MPDRASVDSQPEELPESEHRALEHLTRAGGAGLVGDMIAIYLTDTPAKVSAARAALAAGDAAALAGAAHAMKSSSAQLGAVALADACAATEDAAERGDAPTAKACLSRVEAEYAAFRERLSRHAGVIRPTVKSAQSPAEGRVIAVVEDNADNRLLVDAILGGRFVLHEYVTGIQALDAMRKRVPALVLLDVSLPGMDGLEVLTRMRVDPMLRGVPVVALTAHAMAGDRERYLAAGFDDYVAKPIEDEDVLIGAIERLLSRAGPRTAEVTGGQPPRP
jgi:two-component system cell cycle response regulator DivK